MAETKKGHKEWFNRRCEMSRVEKEKAWNRWRRNRSHNNWVNYINMRNKYVTIRRVERRNYEKDIVDKCKDQPKLFYRYVNGKLKNKSGTTKLKINDETYEDAQMMAEVMNECFQSVFTIENNFQYQQPGAPEVVGLEDIHITVEEVKKIMEEKT